MTRLSPRPLTASLLAPLLAAGAGGCTPTCATPAREGVVEVVIGEDELLRAAGEDAVAQDAECRALCTAYAPYFAELDRCATRMLEAGEGPFDTASTWNGPQYVLECGGTFYCL